jgi:hypothetical protein
MKGECECCQSKDVEVKEYDRGPVYKGKWNLCVICSHTHVSTAVMYNQQERNPALMQAVAFIGNMILKELRNK